MESPSPLGKHPYAPGGRPLTRTAVRPPPQPCPHPVTVRVQTHVTHVTVVPTNESRRPSDDKRRTKVRVSSQPCFRPTTTPTSTYRDTDGSEGNFIPTTSYPLPDVKPPSSPTHPTYVYPSTTSFLRF